MKFLLFVSLTIIFLLHGAAVKKATNNSEQKLQQITDLALKSKNNVITLDDSTYAYYATSRPNPYHLIVFLTAAHPKFRCGVCKSLDKEFQLLASSYSIEMKARKESPEVFFIRLDYESSQRVFQSYQVNSVPVVFHLPVRISDKSTNSNDNQINVRDKYQAPADPDAESLANFLREKTSIQVPIKRSMIMIYVIILIVFGVLLALVQPVVNALPFILRIIRIKYIWLVVSGGVYTISISGMIFDIIRSPQMYYANPQTGQIMFFHPQSGSQFVAEGFIIGFLNVAAALGLIFLAVIAPKFKGQRSKDYSLVAGMIIFVACFLQTRGLYKMKNRWYGMAG